MVPDPDGLAGHTLNQRYRGTRITFGVLPTGLGQASLFWSAPARDLASIVAAGPEAWAAAARPFAGPWAALVDRAVATGILEARYRDVVVRSPYRLSGRAGAVLLGDAAHAMSPQLGLGASLALADAQSLARSVRAHPGDLPAALEAHARARRAHVRWYTWCSRLMTPAFQSDLPVVGAVRDAVMGPAGRVPWVRRQFVERLMGIKTSPWSRWTPPA